MGIQFDLQNRYRNSYIAVLYGKEIVYEAFSEQLLKYDYAIGSNIITITSAGYECGNNASIKFNGKEYSSNDEIKFRSLLNTILEPSLRPFYKAIDKDFENKYIIE